MKLHYRIVGSGRPLVILHGLFGSADNWRGLAKKLSTQIQVITVDLRNHGYSPHSSEQNYPLMTTDLVELLDDLNIKAIDIIGHSIGGKIAMTFAQHYPDRVNKLIIVDIAPRQYKSEHQQIFEALLAIDLSQYSKRSEVEVALAQSLPDKAVRQFLLMNLNISSQQLTWRINLSALFKNYHRLLEAVCERETIETPCRFIRGGRSHYVQDADEEMIQQIFIYADIVQIEHAGHWVHAEAPEQFLTKVTEFFNDD